MINDYLVPISLEKQAQYASKELSIGSQVHFIENAEDASWNEYDIILVSINEVRGSAQKEFEYTQFDTIRAYLYEMAVGNWYASIADIGEIRAGNTQQDSQFALQEVINFLYKNNKKVIVLGGAQELTLALYQAIAQKQKTVNIATLDRQIDMSIEEESLSSTNFINNLISQPPYKLFNYYQLAYQSYYVPQELKDLIEKLNFEHLRLGEIIDNTEEVEPYLRDSHLLSVDMNVLAHTYSPANTLSGPNGLNGREICTIMRYAGMSNSLNIIGIFEYHPILDRFDQSAQLIAQMIWYYIEGIHLQIEEKSFNDLQVFQKYHIAVENQEYIFYKSILSNKWWIELKMGTFIHYVPASKNDYIQAVNGEIPDRFWKNFKKFLG